MPFSKFITDLTSPWAVLTNSLGTYDNDLPFLASRLEQAMGAKFGGMIDLLQQQIIDPDTGIPDPVLQPFIDSHKAVTDTYDMDFADPTTRIVYKVGTKDGDIQTDFGPIRDEVITEINSLLSQIDDPATPPDDIPELEIKVRWFSLLMSTQFNMLWYLLNYKVNDTDIDADPAWGAFFTVYTNFLDTVIQRTEVELIFVHGAQFRGKLKQKPLLDAKIVAIFPNSIYRVFPPKNVAAYQAGDLIADLAFFTSTIKRVWEYRGCVPMGLSLNETTGDITVSDPGILGPGYYTDILLQVDDCLGGTSQHTITLEIQEDQEAEYFIMPPKSVTAYVADELLARPLDLDGQVVCAVVTVGKVPAGAKFNTTDGWFRVLDPTKMVAGTYDLTVHTKDETGGTTDSDIQLEFLP